jgi:hypothetical protein
MFRFIFGRDEEEILALKAKINRLSLIKEDREQTIENLRDEIENLKMALAFEAGKLKKEREKVLILREALVPYCTCVIPSATTTAVNALAATEDKI